MRVAGSGIGHLVLDDLAGLWIQLADEPRAIPRVPDVAGLVFGQAVRARLRGRQRKFLHGAGLGIEASEHVAPLPGPPDGSVGGSQRIVRARPEGRHHPLADGNLRRAGHHHRLAARLPRKVGPEIGEHLRLHRGRKGDHAARQRVPSLLAVATRVGDVGQRMASGAHRLDLLLAGAVRQVNRTPAPPLGWRLRLHADDDGGSRHERQEHGCQGLRSRRHRRSPAARGWRRPRG